MNEVEGNPGMKAILVPLTLPAALEPLLVVNTASRVRKVGSSVSRLEWREVTSYN